MKKYQGKKNQGHWLQKYKNTNYNNFWKFIKYKSINTKYYI